MLSNGFPQTLFSKLMSNHTLRFGEWSQAVWEEFQRKFLLPSSNNDKVWDMRFLGIHHESDAKTMESSRDNIAGKILNGWWDLCEEAGPKRRDAEEFAIPLPTLDFLTLQDGALMILVTFTWFLH